RHGECFSTLQTHDRANGPAVERGTHHPVVAAEVVRLPHHRTGELMPYIDVGTLMIFKLGKVGIDKASGKRTAVQRVAGQRLAPDIESLNADPVCEAF